MGACLPTSKNNDKKTKEYRKPNQFKKLNSVELDAIDMNVQLNDEDAVKAKLRIFEDRIQTKIFSLRKQENQNKLEIQGLLMNGEKEKAYYRVKVQKEIKSLKKNLFGKLEFIDKQLINIEHGVNDKEFHAIIKESNKVIEQLNSEINMEEVKIAKELEQDGQLRKNELNELLRDDDDQMLKNEIDEIEASMINTTFDKFNNQKQKNQTLQSKGILNNRALQYT